VGRSGRRGEVGSRVPQVVSLSSRVSGCGHRRRGLDGRDRRVGRDGRPATWPRRPAGLLPRRERYRVLIGGQPPARTARTPAARSRCWGTPKSSARMICHHSGVAELVQLLQDPGPVRGELRGQQAGHVLQQDCRGPVSRMIRSASGMQSCSSSWPSCRPVELNGWHDGPQLIRSTGSLARRLSRSGSGQLWPRSTTTSGGSTSSSRSSRTGPSVTRKP
jgi:hypothetical protein